MTASQIQTQTPTTSLTLVNGPLKTLPPLGTTTLPFYNPRIHPRAMRSLTCRRNLSTSMNLRLKRHRVNPVRMKTFPNRLGKTVEIRNDIAVENYMRSGERFGLIQTPDVEFVDGEHAGDSL